MTTELTRNAIRQLLESLGRCLTPDFAHRLLEFWANPAARKRVDRLAGPSTAGTLTPEERDAYKAGEMAAAMIAILQAKARTLLTTRTAASACRPPGSHPVQV
jgi:hypothetical protein